MMKSLSRAAEANDEGSALLELGETNKALKCFRSGLRYLNEGCQQSAIRLPSVPMTEHSAPAAAVSTRPIRVGDNIQNNYRDQASVTSGGASVASSSSREHYSHQPASTFSEAFVFSHEDLVEEDMTIEKHSFFSAVLIYNTALALHQKGCNEDISSSQNRDTKIFVKSLLFYNESMNLLRPIAGEAESFRVIQEILRNQADIYYRLNDLGSLQRVWEELAALTKDRNVPGIHRNTPIALSA